MVGVLVPCLEAHEHSRLQYELTIIGPKDEFAINHVHELVGEGVPMTHGRLSAGFQCLVADTELR